MQISQVRLQRLVGSIYTFPRWVAARRKVVPAGVISTGIFMPGVNPKSAIVPGGRINRPSSSMIACKMFCSAKASCLSDPMK
jgi:hypothetical protein